MPVKIEVGAKANLEVKTEVPSATAGRFVDAITDIIRPWSEIRGLRADLIRVHREEVGLEIARRAAARIELETSGLRPIPLKILVPLLEKGSQEEADDDFMIDMWANLLASAASSTEVQPRFVGIIGELNGHQARLLQFIALKKGEHVEDYYQEAVLRWLTDELANQPGPEELGDKIDELFKAGGVHLALCFVFAPGLEHGFRTWSSEIDGRTEREVEIDLEVLASLGLLQRESVREVGVGQIENVSISYYCVTSFAQDFLDVVTQEAEGTKVSS
jgi:Abortive infection alpha